MPEILTKIISYLMIAYYTIIPTFSVSYKPYEKAKDDVLFTAAIISDTHLDYREIVLQGTLSYGLKHLNRVGNIDALIVSGDMTNYGDEKSIDTFYNIVRKYSPTKNLVAASGNHDIGHVEDLDHDAVRAYNITHYNEFMGTQFENIYYSVEFKGYKFIVISDQGDRWDHMTILEDQRQFLDKELADGTKDGKPCFVVSHWPMMGINGETTVWDGSGIRDDMYDIKSILEKYDNVFFISGHMHEGMADKAINDKMGFSWCETNNGVNYINLPTYGLVNQYGVFWPGSGAIMEIYENSVVFKARNYLSGKQFKDCDHTFEIV